jgi:hypothetical protein
VQQPRRSFDVREEKRDGSSREVLHGSTKLNDGIADVDAAG